MKRLLFTLLLAAFATGAYVTRAECTESATAKIEDCLVNEGGFNCQKKVVVSVAVSYGLQTKIDAVTVTTIQKDGEPTALEETVEIEIEKSQPVISYPLKFYHTVPYFPYEEVIKVSSTRRRRPMCQDSPSAVDPTCGWALDGDGNKIESSQGFCCNKSIGELVRSRWDDSLWRGEKELEETPTFRNSFSTAHCMRPGELYFHGYEIGEALEYVEIYFKLRKGDPNHQFYLTTTEPFYSVDTTDFKVKAEISGESDKYRGAPDLSNYILYIPASPDTHPLVQDYQHNMLLVPREEVSKDGSECNKVGVSFHTFRSQANSCQTSEAGDCLHNQLFQKHSSDLQKLAMNPEAETTYLVHGKKPFKKSMDFKPGMEKVLQYKIPHIDYSQISLTMDLDTIKRVSTESLGIIEEAYVKTFESMSKNGTLVAEIKNFGDLKTDYVATISNCKMNIVQAIPAQARLLEPLEPATLYFDINTAYNLDSTNECLVQLKSPTGRLYDEVYVKFDTFKHESKYSWELLEKNKDTEVTK